MSQLVVGMLVQSKHRDMPLRRGGEWYPAAVVAQVDPLVLISEDGDMMWATNMESDDFEPCGVASTQSKINVNDRIVRTGEPIKPLTVTDVELATMWFKRNGDKEVDLGQDDMSKAVFNRFTSRVTVEEMYQMFKYRMSAERGVKLW